MSELLTIGEPITLFAATDLDESLTTATHFQKYLAGAEVNVAVGTARLGHSVQYLSQVGQDAFGDFIREQLQANHVGIDYLTQSPAHWTGLQFKNKVSHGDPATAYFRAGSAAAHMTPTSLRQVDLTGVRWAHLTGIYPAISYQALATVQQLILMLQAHHIPFTFDPNIRPSLWPDHETMVTTLNALAREATIVLPGIGEGEQLAKTRDPEAIADFYLTQGKNCQAVVVKLGPAGALVKTKAGQTTTVAGFHVDHVVDTVGAGDGFALGLLTGILDDLPLVEAVRRANAVGAIAVQHPGDNDGYPTPAALAAFMQANASSVDQLVD